MRKMRYREFDNHITSECPSWDLNLNSLAPNLSS